MSEPECRRDPDGASCNGCTDGMIGVFHIKLGVMVIRLCSPCMTKIYRWWRKDSEKDRFFCLNCGKGHDSFMVHKKIWEEAGYHPKANCCLPCLENNLGRELTMNDFTPAPINNAIRWAYQRGVDVAAGDESE